MDLTHGFSTIADIINSNCRKVMCQITRLEVGLPLETDTGFLLTESKTSGIDTIERTDFLFKISHLTDFTFDWSYI